MSARTTRHRSRTRVAVAALTATCSVGALTALPAQASASPEWSASACPPSAHAIGDSDALDKAVVDGVTVGGLSDLASDAGSGSFVATVDNNATDPARLYRLGPDPLAPLDHRARPGAPPPGRHAVHRRRRR